MRPLDVFTRARSTPCSAAIRRASGEALTRASEVPAVVDVNSDGLGAPTPDVAACAAAAPRGTAAAPPRTPAVIDVDSRPAEARVPAGATGCADGWRPADSSPIAAISAMG